MRFGMRVVPQGVSYARERVLADFDSDEQRAISPPNLYHFAG